MGVASSPPLPDPRGVTTTAGLAELLHQLRLTAARPSPTDNPLTLREMSVLTGLPPSTLGNAESGRVLPRVEVVYRFAQACGVPEDQLSWWAQARNQVLRHRRRDPHASRAGAREGAGRRAVPLLAPVRDVGSEQAPSSPEALWQELGGVAIEQAAGRLVSQDPDDVVTLLQRLQPVLVAGLLGKMDPVIGALHLGGLPAGHAVACLNAMAPYAAARLLAVRSVAEAVNDLTLMQPEKAVATLLAMPPLAMAQRLVHLDISLVEQVVRGMPLQQRTALLVGPPLPRAVTVELLFSLDFEQSCALVKNSSPRIAARTLATLPADPAAGLLTALPVETGAEVLAAMEPAQAAAVVMEMSGHDAAVRLQNMPLRIVGDLLSEIPVSSAARLLAWFPTPRNIHVFQHIRADRSAMIRLHVQSNVYQSWLGGHPTHRGRWAAPPTVAELGTFLPRPPESARLPVAPLL